MMKAIAPLADGNVGTLRFLIQLVTTYLYISAPIVAKIEQTGIKGTDLYTMYSDLCNKDFDKVLKLCEKCPDDILIDACSRQDYSGRELVKKYLN